MEINDFIHFFIYAIETKKGEKNYLPTFKKDLIDRNDSHRYRVISTLYTH